jgi:hypothetical protein
MDHDHVLTAKHAHGAMVAPGIMVETQRPEPMEGKDVGGPVPRSGRVWRFECKSKHDEPVIVLVTVER